MTSQCLIKFLFLLHEQITYHKNDAADKSEDNLIVWRVSTGEKVSFFILEEKVTVSGGLHVLRSQQRVRKRKKEASFRSATAAAAAVVAVVVVVAILFYQDR